MASASFEMREIASSQPPISRSFACWQRETRSNVRDNSVDGEVDLRTLLMHHGQGLVYLQSAREAVAVFDDEQDS